MPELINSRASFHDELLHERIADLYRCTFRFGFFRQFLGCEGCTVNTVAACCWTDVEYWVAYTFGNTALNFVMIDKTDAHRINERIAFVALVEHDFAANGRNPDTVTVSSNSRYHMLEQIFHAIVLQLTETQASSAVLPDEHPWRKYHE